MVLIINKILTIVSNYKLYEYYGFILNLEVQNFNLSIR